MNGYSTITLLVFRSALLHVTRSAEWDGSKRAHVEDGVDEVALSTKTVDSRVRTRCNCPDALVSVLRVLCTAGDRLMLHTAGGRPQKVHTRPSAIRKTQERTLFREAAGLPVMLRRWRVAPGTSDQWRLKFLSSRVAQPVGRAAQVVQRILCTAQVRRAKCMLLHVTNRLPMHEGAENHLPFV